MYFIKTYLPTKTWSLISSTHSEQFDFEIMWVNGPCEENMLTLSTPHATIVALNRCVQKVPSLELLRATEFSLRVV